jgi:hypothetical protein
MYTCSTCGVVADDVQPTRTNPDGTIARAACPAHLRTLRQPRRGWRTVHLTQIGRDLADSIAADRQRKQP